MWHLWRISNHENLSGAGGLRYGARWHSAGSRIVYLAESPAGALIEILVHLELDQFELPDTYKLLRVSVPAEIQAEDITGWERDKRWKQRLRLTRALGDAWLHATRTALAKVPSAVMPSTWNYLLNPDHPDARKMKIVDVTPARFDPRVLRTHSGRI